MKEKSKLRIWQISTVILAILMIIGLFKLEVITKGTTLSGSEAANKAIDFINKNLIDTGQTATLIDVEEQNNIYKMSFKIGSKIYDAYLTKDGKYLFTSAIDLSETGKKQEQQKVEVSIDDDPMKGQKDAPVTIIEFSDFQCPFCAKFYSETLPQIEDNYIKTGKVKLVFRDFPLSFHENAQKAAEASECADEQEKFWEYHDKLFENQQNLEISNLKQYAKDLNLDTIKFDDCLDSGKMASEVKKDFNDGQGYGVSGTPAFFINGKLISGALPFENFRQIIEEELA